MVTDSFPQTKLYMGHREYGKLTRFLHTLQKARKLLSHEMTEGLAVRGGAALGAVRSPSLVIQHSQDLQLLPSRHPSRAASVSHNKCEAHCIRLCHSWGPVTG